MSGLSMVFWVLCLWLGASSHAADGLDGLEPEQVFMEANRAQTEGDHRAAIARYEALVDAGYASSEIYFNLGNSHFKSEALGAAIAAYRRAQVLAPRDADIAANLSAARLEVEDDVVPPQADPVWRTLLFWHHYLGRGEVLGLLGGFNILFWLALGVRRFRPGLEWLRWLCWGLALPLVALGGSWLSRQAMPSVLGVVVEPTISVYTSTSVDSVVRFKLHEGVEAQVVDILGEWAQISLSDGKQGWVERELIEEVGS